MKISRDLFLWELQAEAGAEEEGGAPAPRTGTDAGSALVAVTPRLFASHQPSAPNRVTGGSCLPCPGRQRSLQFGFPLFMVLVFALYLTRFVHLFCFVLFCADVTNSR